MVGNLYIKNSKIIAIEKNDHLNLTSILNFYK